MRYLNIFKLSCLIVTNPPPGLTTVWALVKRARERVIQCDSDTLNAIFKYLDKSLIFLKQDDYYED